MKLIHVILLISIVGVVGLYYVQPEIIWIDNNCNITKTQCFLKKEKIEVYFNITPRPITQNSPVSYEIKVQAPFPIRRVVVNLIGHFDEGERELIELISETDQYFYRADRQFPLCSDGYTDWEAVISIIGEKKVIRTNFNFSVQKVK